MTKFALNFFILTWQQMWGEKNKNKLKYEDMSSIPELNFDPEYSWWCELIVPETGGSLVSVTSQPGENRQVPGPSEETMSHKAR